MKTNLRFPSVGELAGATLIILLAAAGVADWSWSESIYSLAFFFADAIYFLGFFVFLPEAVGRSITDPQSLSVRWSAWLHWSAFLALLYGAAAACRVGTDLSPHERIAFLGLGVPIAYCAGAAGIALHRRSVALSKQSSTGHGSWAVSKLGLLMKNIGMPARWVMNWLTPRRALSSGSPILVLTLLLVLSFSYGCAGGENYRGYQILSGEASWITAENILKPVLWHTIIRFTGWAAYALALMLACFTLGVLSSPAGSRIRRPTVIRWARNFSGFISLFVLSDLVFALFSLDSTVREIIILCIYWLVPLLALLVNSRHPQSPKEHVKIVAALQILFLPVVLIGFGILVCVSGDAPGLVAFVVGILLLWWGYILLLNPAIT